MEEDICYLWYGCMVQEVVKFQKKILKLWFTNTFQLFVMQCCILDIHLSGTLNTFGFQDMKCFVYLMVGAERASYRWSNMSFLHGNRITNTT